MHNFYLQHPPTHQSFYSLYVVYLLSFLEIWVPAPSYTNPVFALVTVAIGNIYQMSFLKFNPHGGLQVCLPNGSHNCWHVSQQNINFLLVEVIV